MIDDYLDRFDVEHAILHGVVEKKLTKDIRGTRYRIEGPAKDGRLIDVICRFKATGHMTILTVYALTEEL